SDRRGTPPPLEKGARILAALRRLSAQDRARDTGGRAGSSSIAYSAAGLRSERKARSKGEGSSLGGSTGMRPFAEECLRLRLSRVHPSAVPQVSMLHSYFGLCKATPDRPPRRVLRLRDQLPF